MPRLRQSRRARFDQDEHPVSSSLEATQLKEHQIHSCIQPSYRCISRERCRTFSSPVLMGPILCRNFVCDRDFVYPGRISGARTLRRSQQHLPCQGQIRQAAGHKQPINSTPQPDEQWHLGYSRSNSLKEPGSWIEASCYEHWTA